MERRNFLGALTGTSSRCPVERLFAEFPREQNTAQAGGSVACSRSFRNFSSRGFRKHSIRAPLWKGAGHSDGGTASRAQA